MFLLINSQEIKTKNGVKMAEEDEDDEGWDEEGEEWDEEGEGWDEEGEEGEPKEDEDDEE